MCFLNNIYFLFQLRADIFNSVIESMYNEEKYGEMAIYLGSCESGSMFDGLLSPTINGSYIASYENIIIIIS